jgi:hypothetical protein
MTTTGQTWVVRVWISVKVSKNSIESAESTLHDAQAVGVLRQQDGANEDVTDVDGSIERRVGGGFDQRFDVDIPTSSAGIFCTAVGGFSHSRTADGGDRGSELREFHLDLEVSGVIGITLFRARRTEDRDARGEDVEFVRAPWGTDGAVGQLGVAIQKRMDELAYTRSMGINYDTRSSRIHPLLNPNPDTAFDNNRPATTGGSCSSHG